MSLAGLHGLELMPALQLERRGGTLLRRRLLVDTGLECCATTAAQYFSFK